MTPRLAVIAVVLPALALTPGAARGEDNALARARALYDAQCALCHGRDGAGDGSAVPLLTTPPRNLRKAQYRFVSTWEGVATDADLLRTISEGLPGTQMPSYAELDEAERWALVAVVKSLAEEPWEVAPQQLPDGEGSPGTGVVVVPPEPLDSRTNQARAQELFADACAECHGDTGRGNGRADLVDSDGHPIRPRDFVDGAFKGGASPEAIYRRIVIGTPGTPMPANDWAYGDDAWYLVRHVLAFSGR